MVCLNDLLIKDLIMILVDSFYLQLNLFNHVTVDRFILFKKIVLECLLIDPPPL